jgi:hypothetical protein
MDLMLWGASGDQYVTRDRRMFGWVALHAPDIDETLKSGKFLSFWDSKAEGLGGPAHADNFSTSGFIDCVRSPADRKWSKPLSRQYPRARTGV